MEFLEYLVLLTLCVLLLTFLMEAIPYQEPFKNSATRLEDDSVWDEFYSKVYDQLFSIPERLQMEWTVIEEALDKFPKSKIDVLDVGCGTAPQAKSIVEYKPNTYVGLDQSPYMINKARENHKGKDQTVKFVVGDVMNQQLYSPKSFSHVLCLYFTIYSVQDIRQSLENMYNWIRNGGYLILHVVDPEKFDPVLDSASPFPAFSIQKYSKERVMESEVEFDTFTYKAKFNKKPHEYEAHFEETFTFKDDKTPPRVHRHNLTMPPKDTVLRMATEAGWSKDSEFDMTSGGYEYQYLVTFKK